MSYNRNIIEYMLNTLSDTFEYDPLIMSFVESLERDVRHRQETGYRMEMNRQRDNIRTQRMDPMFHVPPSMVNNRNDNTNESMNILLRSIDNMIDNLEGVIEQGDVSRGVNMVDETRAVGIERSNAIRRNRRNALYNRQHMIYPDEYEELANLTNVETPLRIIDLNRNTKLKIKGENEEMMCNICIENIKKDEIYREIKCGHKYHVGCIDKWFETSKTCPLCRESLES